MKHSRANHSILGVLTVAIFLTQTSCKTRSENEKKPIHSNSNTKTIAGEVVGNSMEADSCDDDGGEVDNFGIIGGKTISQRSPLARGVVKLYAEYYDTSANKVVSGSSCTGALIDANIILTAGHCVQIPEEVASKHKGPLRQRVFALYGSNPFCKVDKGDYSRAFLVDGIKIHENFGSKDGNGDIALLRTEKPMSGEHTYYKLDAQTHDFNADEKLVGVGYGKNKGYFVQDDKESPLKIALLNSNKSEVFEKKFIDKVFNAIPAEAKKQFYDSFEAELQKQNQPQERSVVEVMVDEYLKKTFIKGTYFNYTDTSENLLFDQSNNESICAGDSGGPGLRSHADTLRIVGVAKSVSADSDQNEPCSFSAIYTNVSFHKAWIIKNFNELANKDSVIRGKGELVFE